MSDPVRWTGQMPPVQSGGRQPQSGGGGGDGTNLADILERVLDKGIVIAGDIQINLLDIELLTIKLRLVVASVDRAREMGIDWWERDPTLSSGYGELADENDRLRARIAELESGGRRNGHRRRRIEDADVDAVEDADGVEDVDDVIEDADVDGVIDDAEVDDAEVDDLADEEPADVDDAESDADEDADVPDDVDPEPTPVARRSRKGSRR